MKPAIFRIVFGAVEYRGPLDPWLASNADALEPLIGDDDLTEIRSLEPGERYSPETEYPMAFSFTCLEKGNGT